MEINERDNEKTIKKLEGGINKGWELFLYGDKENNIRPGRIETYGIIKGQQEVLSERLKIREEMREDQPS